MKEIKNLTPNIKSALKDAVCWILVNAVGIGTYLSFEFWILAPRSEAYAFSPIDIIYFWLKLDLPVLTVFLVLNIIWLILILMRGRSNGNVLAVWLFVCLAWVFAPIFHGIAVVMIRLAIDMVDGRAWK